MKFQLFYFDSTRIVIGPSLSRATSISAPNTPVEIDLLSIVLFDIQINRI